MKSVLQYLILVIFSFFININHTLGVGALTATVSPSYINVSLTKGLQINLFKPVIPSGGSGHYSYSISPSLPLGLLLNPLTGNVTGLSTETKVSTDYTVTVTDLFNVSVPPVSAIFTLSVYNPLTVVQAIASTSLTVNTPIVPFLPVTITGGSSVYVCAITPDITALTGLSFNTSTCQISGTPTTASANTSYTVTVADSTNAGNNGNVSFNLAVNAPSGSGSTPVTATVAGSIPASATVGTAITAFTPVTGGGGSGTYIYSINPDIAAQTGLSFNAGTGQISGAPTIAKVNTSYTVTVKDSADITKTANASFSFAVNVPSGSGSTPVTATVAGSIPTLTKGTAVTPFTPVTGGGGSGSFTYSVTPALSSVGLNINSSAGQVTGTPTVVQTSTNYTVTVVDSTNPSNNTTASFNLTINAPSGAGALTINPATLPDPTSRARYRQILSASGGTAPYTFTLSGSLPSGISLSPDGVISGVTKDLGVYTFIVTVTDVHGATGSRTYTIHDPAPNRGEDPNVIGQVTAQVQVVERFIQVQINNIVSHFQQLHANFTDTQSYNNLNMQIAQSANQQADALAANTTARNNKTLDKRNKEKNQHINNKQWNIPGLWVGGDVNFGSYKINGTKNKFTTAGVSMGIDRMIRKNLIVGAAIGFGWDDVKTDGDGSKTKVTSPFGSFYASFKATDKLFIDGVIGYGEMRFENTRWERNETLSTVFVKGTRRAPTWFGSLAATLSQHYNQIKFDPYIRGDFSKSRLRAYTESGDTEMILTYKPVRINYSAISGGTFASFDIKRTTEVLTPFLKLEYTRNASSSRNQVLHPYDTPTELYSMRIARVPKDSVSGQLGLRYRGNYGITWELNVGGGMGSNSYKSKTVGANLKIPLN